MTCLRRATRGYGRRNSIVTSGDVFQPPKLFISMLQQFGSS